MGLISRRGVMGIFRFVAQLFVLNLMTIGVSGGAVFDYPRDAGYVVIEYTQTLDMILDADPEPQLRIYGDGRVLVHYPAYMKRAGDYEMQLTDAELQQLLNSLDQKGLINFDRSKVLQLKSQSAARIAASSGNNIVTTRSDDSRTRININLDAYSTVFSRAPQTNIRQVVKWKNLRWDAQTYPDVAELQNAAAAEQVLRDLLTHRNLVKIK